MGRAEIMLSDCQFLCEQMSVARGFVGFYPGKGSLQSSACWENKLSALLSLTGPQPCATFGKVERGCLGGDRKKGAQTQTLAKPGMSQNVPPSPSSPLQKLPGCGVKDYPMEDEWFPCS